MTNVYEQQTDEKLIALNPTLKGSARERLPCVLFLSFKGSEELNEKMIVGKYFWVIIYRQQNKFLNSIILDMKVGRVILNIKNGVVQTSSREVSRVTVSSVRIELTSGSTANIEQIIRFFFDLHDPTSSNSSSIIFTTSSHQHKTLKAVLQKVQKEIIDGALISYHPPSLRVYEESLPLQYSNSLIQTRIMRAGKFFAENVE